MQKLKFRNSKGNEIDFTSGNYGITNINGLSETELNIQTQQVPFQDGSVFIDSLLQDRVVSVTLAINDEKDLEKRYRLKREIIQILNPKLGEGVLIYENDFIQKQIKCVAQMPVFPNKNADEGGTLKASLSFDCPSPYWEDIEDTEVELPKDDYVEIKNNGDIETPVTITFIPNENETLNNPELFDINEDLIIGYNGEFSEKNLEISTNFGEKTVVLKNLKEWNKTLELNLIINDIIYSNKLWIAICNNGIIEYSSDGINWTSKSITNDNLFHIVFGKNKFIVTCNNGKSYYSSDGINWLEGGDSGNGKLGLIYYNGFFVSYQKDSISTSDDGISWNNYKLNVTNADELHNKITIDYINKNIVATDDSGKKIIVNDINSVINKTNYITGGIQVIYVNNKYYFFEKNTKTIFISEDLKTAISICINDDFISGTCYSRHLMHDGEKFILFTKQRILVSEDCLIWNEIYTTSNIICGVACNEKKYIMFETISSSISSNAKLYYSTDLINWDTPTLKNKNNVTLTISSTNFTSLTNQNLNIDVVNNKFIIHSMFSAKEYNKTTYEDYIFMFSEDGSTWLCDKRNDAIKGFSLTRSLWGKIFFVNGYYYYFGTFSTPYRKQENSFIWEQLNTYSDVMGIGEAIKGCWTGSEFIMLNTNKSCVLTSPDANNWIITRLNDYQWVGEGETGDIFFSGSDNFSNFVNNKFIIFPHPVINGREYRFKPAILDIQNKTITQIMPYADSMSFIVKDLIYFDNKYIIISNDKNIYYTNDFKTYTHKDDVFSENPLCMKFKNNIIYILCENGKIYTSRNGIDFSIEDIGNNENIKSMEYHNEVINLITEKDSNNSIYTNRIVKENKIENIIGNIGFKLTPGSNFIKFKTENGNGIAKLTFKNKYIGV